MVTNGDSGNIGANGTNDDPLETITIHWSYNGTNGDNNANGDNGDNGDNGVNGENKSNGKMATVATLVPMTIHWRE